MLPDLAIIAKNVLNKSCSELNFLQNSQWAHMSTSLPEWSHGAPKIAVFEILQCIEMGR